MTSYNPFGPPATPILRPYVFTSADQAHAIEQPSTKQNLRSNDSTLAITTAVAILIVASAIFLIKGLSSPINLRGVIVSLGLAVPVIWYLFTRLIQFNTAKPYGSWTVILATTLLILAAGIY